MGTFGDEPGVSEILCKLTKVGDKKEVAHGNT
jgi:hypothetical protein